MKPPAAVAAVDPYAAFREEALRLLGAAAAKLGHTSPLPALETPPDPSMGDAGLPCFPLAKALRKSPAAIASELAAAVELSGAQWVVSATAAGPYVNLRLDAARMARTVLADPAAVLQPPAGKGRILLEHTSANPNGPLHVGRARNPILGDSLARVLRAAGHTVEVQYYMDNLGRQVATLAWGKWNLDPGTLPPVQYTTPEHPNGKIDHDLVRYYQAAHDLAKKDPAVGAQIKRLVEELESADAALLQRVRPVYEACFAGMLESLHRLGARYDSVKDESDVVLDGSVARTVEALKRLPLAGVEEDGANYLDLSSKLKGQKDKFYFTRKDGTSVYATRDIAYHAWKAQKVAADAAADTAAERRAGTADDAAAGKRADTAEAGQGARADASRRGLPAAPVEGRLVNVLGEDHRLQALQVGTALEALGVQRPTVVFYSFVSLPEGKMSTRANRVVFVDDLLDEAAERAYAEVQQRRGHELPEADLRRIAEAVGVAAVRFNIARIQAEKPIEFRWEEALNFEGDSAPYLLYAFARANNLLAKCREAGLRPTAPADLSAAPIEPGEERVLRAVARYPVAVADAAQQLAPHRFCAYAIELAAAFNEYYRDHRVLECEDPAQQRLRLATATAAHAALRRTLETLGLPVLESM